MTTWPESPIGIFAAPKPMVTAFSPVPTCTHLWPNGPAIFDIRTCTGTRPAEVASQLTAIRSGLTALLATKQAAALLHGLGLRCASKEGEKARRTVRRMASWRNRIASLVDRCGAR